MENKKKSLWQFFQMLGKTFMFPIALLSVRYAAGNRIGIHKFKSDRGGSIAG